MKTEIWVVEIKYIGLSAIHENKCIGKIDFVPTKGDRLIFDNGLETMREFIVESINHDLKNKSVIVFVIKDETYFKKNMKGIKLE